MFKIGDKVIHNSYGLCEISGIETVDNTHRGKQDCYVIYLQKTKIMIPIIYSETLRFPVSKEEIPNILSVLNKLEDLSIDLAQKNRIDFYGEKFKTNDPFKYAEILRDLTFLREAEKVNEKEKYLLNSAKKILIEEFSFVQGVPKSEIEKTIHQYLRKVTEKAKCQKK